MNNILEFPKKLSSLAQLRPRPEVLELTELRPEEIADLKDLLEIQEMFGEFFGNIIQSYDADIGTIEIEEVANAPDFIAASPTRTLNKDLENKAEEVG
jgi:hypothetical protein